MLICKTKKLNKIVTKKFWDACIRNEYNRHSKFIFGERLSLGPNGVKTFNEFNFSTRELQIFENNMLPGLLNEKIIAKIFLINNSGKIMESPNNQPTELINYKFTEKGLILLSKYYDKDILKESKSYFAATIDKIKKLVDLLNNLKTLIVFIVGIISWKYYEKIFIWVKHLFHIL